MGDSGKLDELLETWEEQAQAGREPSLADLCRDNPELLPELQHRVEALKNLGWMAGYVAPPSTDKPSIEGYRLLSKLGQGGFGQVWKAQGPNGEVVAIKIVELAEDAQSEWRVIEQLKKIPHPNILTIINAWKTNTGLVIAMELGEGSLMDRFCQCRGQGLPGIPGEELDLYMRQAAAGIDALHASNVTHRDIKPSNLLLVGGVVKVADFGLAKALVRSRTAHTGAVTLDYAAPEYLEGQTTKAGDQYSLAISYCQLRGGRVPFEGTPAQVMAGHLRRTPDLEMLSEPERPAILRALAKNPADRWPCCTDFVDSLGRPIDDALVRAPERKKRWRWVLAGIVSLCVFSLVGVLFWAMRHDRTDKGLPGESALVGQKDDGDLPAQQSKMETGLNREPKEVEQGKPIKTEETDFDSLPSFMFDGKGACIMTPVERFAPVTLECWAKLEQPQGTHTEQYLIGSTDLQGKRGIGVGFTFREGLPILGVQLIPSPTEWRAWTTTSIPLNKWVHVAGVFRNTKTSIYLNGEEVGQTPPTANLVLPGDSTFQLGAPGKRGIRHFFMGRIRTARISQGERYSGNFKPTMEFARDDSAVLIYSASNVEQRVRVIDLSGKNNHGVMNGAKVIQPKK